MRRPGSGPYFALRPNPRLSISCPMVYLPDKARLTVRVTRRRIIRASGSYLSLGALLPVGTVGV